MTFRSSRHDLMLRAYYGELSPKERVSFEQILERDTSFRAEYAAMVSTLEQLREGELPLPEQDSFWIGLEHSILHRIRREQRRSNHWWDSLRRWWSTSAALRISVAVASITVVYIAGVYVGSHSLDTSTLAGSELPHLPLLPIHFEPSARANQLAAHEHVKNFLKRSQLYIATTADRDLACTRCIPIQQQLDHRQFARELLREAQNLRPLVHHNPKVKKVLQDVELVLANLSQNPQALSRDQVELLHNIASSTICEVSATIENSSTSESVSQP